MLPKILRYEDPFFANTGEPIVQLLNPYRNKAGFYKHACQEVNDYLGTIRPCPGKRYVLVLAMSAGEYYGPNRNGDAFSEGPIKVGKEWAVKPGETLVDHYKTFETHAHCFRHHINKDPSKKLGDVVKAFYNFEMHRVELILEVDEERGNDIVLKLDRDEFPGVSMGCRIKYDVCSICGNRAPTREQYCEHVNGLNPAFGMNQLTPDGERCFVWNPSPTLFDISFVFKPADRIGYTMQKIAYSSPYEIKMSADLGADTERLVSKRAALQKVSDIDKIFQGEIVDTCRGEGLSPVEHAATQRLVHDVVPRVMSRMERLPSEVLDQASSKSLPVIMSTMNACGMCPTTSEIHHIISRQQGLVPDDRIAQKIVRMQGVIADVLSSIPHVFDTIENAGLLSVAEENVDEDLAETLTPYIEKRALWEEQIAQRYIPESVGVPLGNATGLYDSNRVYYTPTRGNLHYQDPSTNRIYQTTNEAARRASTDNLKKSLIEGAGLAALTGVATKAVGASNKWRWLAPVTVGVGVTGGRTLMRGQQVPEVETVEGIRVPANTEFVEKRSNFLSKGVKNVASDIAAPLAGGALLTFLVAQDHLNAGDTVGNFAKENPELTALVSTGILSGGKHKMRQLRSGFKNAMMDLTKTASYDPHQLPSVNFDDLVHRVGRFILES